MAKQKKENDDRDIIAIVHGEKMSFTRKEALSLASQLLISVEVSLE